MTTILNLISFAFIRPHPWPNLISFKRLNFIKPCVNAVLCHKLIVIPKLDYPALFGVTLVVAFVYVMINLLIDVIYALLDPRIRVQ